MRGRITLRNLQRVETHVIRRLCYWLGVPGALVMARRALLVALCWEGVVSDG